MVETVPSHFPGTFNRRDLACLVGLLLLAIGLRGWQIVHTEVAARDSIRFIRVAWRLEHEDWKQVLRTCGQHPAYPAAITAAAPIVRAWLPDDLPRAMQMTSQLVSSVASLFLVTLVYLLGREWFDRSTAFWAAVLFQCLPASGRLLGDGLSEPLFLMFAVGSVLAASVGMRRGSSGLFAVAGVSGALAYLTRPEGAVVVAAAGLVLLTLRWHPAARMAWPRVLLNGTALSIGFLVLAVPYMATIGGLTAKNTGSILLHGTPSVGEAPAARPADFVNAPILLADWWDGIDPDPRARIGWASRALVRVPIQGLCYVGAFLAAVGIWRRRDLFRQHPGHWIPVVIVSLLAVLLYKVAVQFGYLSERHWVLGLLFACYWAVIGATEIGTVTAERLALRPGLRWVGPLGAVPLLLLFCGLPLIRTLQPMHADRAGFKAAGYWIAAHSQPGDAVDDAYCWSHYYAGRVFHETQPDLPAQRPVVHYVVLEHSSNDHPRLRTQTESQVIEKGGILRAVWPVRRRRREQAEIRVYEVPGPMPPPSNLPLRWSKFQT